MADYPELSGLEGSPCTMIAPVGVGTGITVAKPYKNQGAFTILQKPIVSDIDHTDVIYMFQNVWNNPDADDEGGIGYDSQRERDILARLLQLANSTNANSSSYHPSAKAGIKYLASQAYKALLKIAPAYRKAANIEYGVPPVPGRDIESVTFPLSVPDEDVWAVIDPDYRIPYTTRRWTRQAIREHYVRALSLLWCALYGANQSKVYNENKRVYDSKKHGSFAPTPVTPGLRFIGDLGILPPEPPPPGPRFKATPPTPPPGGGFRPTPVPDDDDEGEGDDGETPTGFPPDAAGETPEEEPEIEYVDGGEEKKGIPTGVKWVGGILAAGGILWLASGTGK